MCAQRGRETPGLGSRGPSDHKGSFACLPKELERQLELRKSRVGGGRFRHGAGACTDPKPPLRARGSLRPGPCPAPSPPPPPLPLTCPRFQHDSPAPPRLFPASPRTPCSAGTTGFSELRSGPLRQGHPPGTPFPPIPSLPNRVFPDRSSNRHACARPGEGTVTSADLKPDAPGACHPCDRGQVASPLCACLLGWMGGSGVRGSVSRDSLDKPTMTPILQKSQKWRDEVTRLKSRR